MGGVIINREAIKKVCKGNICYLYNKEKKIHLFVSTEVLEYIDYYKSNNISIRDFLYKFEDINDRKYIKKVLDKMNIIGYFEQLKNDSEEKEMKNIDNIYFLLTKKCNLKCIHCSTSCAPEEKEILSIDQAKTIINNIKKLGIEKIVFTGGEPMLHSDFFEIVEYAKLKLKNVQFILSTNGTLINKINISFLIEKFDIIEISLDGIDEKSCDSIRGKGVFEKVIASIKLLQKYNFYNITLSTVVGENQEAYIEKFYKLNEKLKTKPLIRALEPTGRALDNRNIFYEEKTLLPLSIPDIYKESSSKSRDISSCSCSAYERIILIDHEGYAYPCPSLYEGNFYIANFLDDNFSEIELMRILNTKRKKFQKILDFKGTICETCDINIFCWNCPAHFLKAKENNQINTWCKKMNKNINQIVWRQIGS